MSRPLASARPTPPPAGFVAIEKLSDGRYLVKTYRMPSIRPARQDVVTDAELTDVVANLVDRLATGSGPKEAA
jgi:hypothetical protein